MSLLLLRFHHWGKNNNKTNRDELNRARPKASRSAETSGADARHFSAPSATHDLWTVHQLTATTLRGSDDSAHKASFIKRWQN